MFCSKCGKEIANPSDFCPYCGTSINKLTDSKNTGKMQTNDDLALLKSAEKYLNSIWPYIIKIDELERKKDSLNKDIEEDTKGNIKVGIISSIVSIITLMLAFRNSIRINSVNNSGLIENIGIKFDSFFSSIILIIGIISFIVALVSFLLIPNRKKTIEDEKLKVAEIENQIQNCYYKISEIQKDKTNSMNMEAYKIMFPNGNVFPEDISYIINLIATGRASNFKEALNLFDEHLHRQKMEELARANLSYAVQAATSASIAANHAIDAASYAKTAASNAKTAAEASLYNAHHKN